jgi:hypothetical protein
MSRSTRPRSRLAICRRMLDHTHSSSINLKAARKGRYAITPPDALETSKPSVNFIGRLVTKLLNLFSQ